MFYNQSRFEASNGREDVTHTNVTEYKFSWSQKHRGDDRLYWIPHDLLQQKDGRTKTDKNEGKKINNNNLLIYHIANIEMFEILDICSFNIII